jgi:hypothetical protein
MFKLPGIECNACARILCLGTQAVLSGWNNHDRIAQNNQMPGQDSLNTSCNLSVAALSAGLAGHKCGAMIQISTGST